MSKNKIRFLPLILLLASLAYCARTVETEGSAPGLAGKDGVGLDPSVYKNTVWLGPSEARTERLTIDEAGTTRIMLACTSYWLRPDGDDFILESHLYRTLQDEEPALVIPVGRAKVTTDGSVCRFELLSDDMNSFYEHQETILFYRSENDPAEDRYYFIDFQNPLLITHAQPNTQWVDDDPFDKSADISLVTDENGAAYGTCVVDGKAMECELLIGHHGWDVTCALVKRGARSAEDVLSFGWIDIINERGFARSCVVFCTYDPMGICGEKDRYTFRKEITFDMAEGNWLGMNLYELMFRLEQDSWQIEPVRLFDNDDPAFHCLHKGEKTLLLAHGNVSQYKFTDRYVSGYALYEGRTLLSWAVLMPIDHRLADDFLPEPDSRLSDVVGSVGYYNIDRYFFLDDCRVAACKFQPYGDWAESDFILLDLYAGD